MIEIVLILVIFECQFSYAKISFLKKLEQVPAGARIPLAGAIS